MDTIKRLTPQTLPVQTSVANTIYVDKDTEQIKVGTGASGSAERIIGDSTVGYSAPDGSASAPSYSFASQPTWGALFSSSYGYGISAGGTARLGVDSTGTTISNSLFFTSALGTIGDVSLSRGAANRLDLATGDSLNVVNGNITFGGVTSSNVLLKNSSNQVLAIRTGDDASAARLSCGSITFDSTLTIKSPSDGVLTLFNNAETSFTRLNLGGVTGSFPAIVRSGSSLLVQTADGGGTYTAISAGVITGSAGTATPAGGSSAAVLYLGSANIGVCFGSGVPTLSAAQGSIYLRTDGSSTSTRLYVNTNGTTGWTAVTTAT